VLLGVPFLVALASAIGGLIRGPHYTSRSSFAPQASDDRESRFLGLAAQFGLNLGRGTPTQSVDFYAELLKSQEVLRAAVLTRYRVVPQRRSADTVEGSLVDVYRVKGGTVEERVARATDVLADQISVKTDIKAGLVKVSTTTRWAGLAVHLNRRLLELVNDFNLRTQQTQAGQERAFVERRMQQAQSDLEAAEGELETFLRRNRRYQDSPQLVFEAARLQRRVDLRQQLYVSLAQSYEQARIQEVRNTPVITIIDRPEVSVRRSGGVVPAGALGLVIGLLLAGTWVFVEEHLTRERVEKPEEYREFQRLRHRGPRRRQ
ncbi:MAG TPA: hypothetical protein VGQ17_11925, partial [Gemmatimonadales bacterium]|nr:hypothetical protein [Gemmatimonadales bacterium]